jgi:hypothetical protein
MQCTNPDYSHLIVSIAQQESGLNPAIVRQNRNGTRDFGLMQVNESNFGLLHLTPATALDPCQSIRAAGDLITILSRYNSGSPTRSVGYATQVVERLRGDLPSPSVPLARPKGTLVDQLVSFTRNPH